MALTITRAELPSRFGQFRLAVYDVTFDSGYPADGEAVTAADFGLQRIVDILPIDAAGVSLISPSSRPQVIAGSDESATRYERLQTELGEGPCRAAYETGGPIAIPNLAEDDRFPRFAKRALDEGLVAVFTFPLRNDGRSLGALDLYRRTAGALDEHDMSVAQTLADVATAYLLNAQARQAKTEFVAAVSHELRTPMTSITGFIELLQDGHAGPVTPAQAEFLDTMKRNGDRLTALADDLLTLSGLEHGTPSHVQRPVDLAQVISTVQATFEPVIAAGRVEVTFDVPDHPVMVRGDVASLESLVTNLLTNALKFTQDGGWVLCRLFIVSGQARIAVSDNGLGIPEAEQRDLFSRYFRSSTAHEHAIQGSGLGLNIVDAIVKIHGGDISVRSKHLAGSTFTVNLPMTRQVDLVLPRRSSDAAH